MLTSKGKSPPKWPIGNTIMNGRRYSLAWGQLSRPQQSAVHRFLASYVLAAQSERKQALERVTRKVEDRETV